MRFKLTLAIIASFAMAPAVAADGPARGIYIGAFGGGGSSTDTNPTHAATTAWTVRFGDTSYHLGAVGIGFTF